MSLSKNVEDLPKSKLTVTRDITNLAYLLLGVHLVNLLIYARFYTNLFGYPLRLFTKVEWKNLCPFVEHINLFPMQLVLE
jgi:hypothetical protein